MMKEMNMTDTICPRACAARRLLLAFALSSLGFGAHAAGTMAPSDPATADPATEHGFLAENDAAMTKMMDGMAIKPSGNVDNDFVGMMTPHHQGAIDMAQAELRYGHNEQLRRIAQEIIVEQQQEILAMRIALGLPLPPPEAAPDQQMPAPSAPVSTQSVPHTSQEKPMTMPMPMQMDHNKEQQ
jgi:hypothetical protein